MVRVILLTIALSSIFTNMKAQEDRKEQIERLRVAFISEELDLSSEEAQVFWPVFNTFRDQRRELEKDIRRIRQLEEKAPLSEQDVLRLNKKVSENRRSIIRIEEQLIIDLMPILGPERTLKLMSIESEFKKRILKNRLERD